MTIDRRALATLADLTGLCMLKYSTYSNAVIAPHETDAKGVRRAGLIVNGAVVGESLVRRRKMAIAAVEDLSLTRALAQSGSADRVIFAGLASANFGHFLLESLARLWIHRLMPGVPLAWIGPTHFNSWQSEILDIIGITGPHVFVQSPERFRSVVLPQVGYRISDFFSRQHRDFLAVVPAVQVIRGRKAWISRSRLSGAGRVLGEDKIEYRLASEGWEIFHPQEHKVIEQLRYLSSCEDIAGWEGSAFHSLILLKNLKTVVHLFQRGLDFNDNYWTIANAKGFVQYVHAPPLSLIGGKSSKRKWELEDAGLVTDVLRHATKRSPFTLWIRQMSRQMEASLPGFASARRLTMRRISPGRMQS